MNLTTLSVTASAGQPPRRPAPAGYTDVRQRKNMARTENILLLTKRLIIMAGISLLLIGGIFAATLIFGNRFMLSWITFGCGLIGGFVSIQQRLNKIGNPELELLSRSWFQILLIPIYGGIFALILYILFLSGIIEGHLFPEFYVPSLPEGSVPTTDFMKDLFSKTYPSSGEDFAKLLFWSFVAGFSERYVPQIISTISNKSGEQSH